jgi:hypothetical protein
MTWLKCDNSKAQEYERVDGLWTPMTQQIVKHNENKIIERNDRVIKQLKFEKQKQIELKKAQDKALETKTDRIKEERMAAVRKQKEIYKAQKRAAREKWATFKKEKENKERLMKIRDEEL